MLLTLSLNGNMFYELVFVLMYILYVPLSVADQLTNDPNKMLNSCLDGMHHKTEPGPEGDLYKQCYPWRDRSCCKYNTTEAAHHAGLYGFKLDHCTDSAKMSTDCRRHFVQDLCFYECSPNIGPWIVKDSGMKIRKERYFEVPLCQSDCEAWFESCYDDYTCTDNWSRNFNWSNGRNHCPAMSKCRTFGSIYGNAGNFCSKVRFGTILGSQCLMRNHV
ncbi:folate receptor beta-like isoform X2 [Hetaerina americana]|uniref:folate receptor beta-like isoform X2 n=1 Tax=Hetaerina americana TaxID=62018 RepID=UPI003A7F4318